MLPREFSPYPRGPRRPCSRALETASKRRRGVTIFELLIVLGLLSFTASVGIPAYFARPSVTLDSAAKLLAKDLREIQNRAALYGEPLELRFDGTGHGYRATDVHGEPLISPYGDGDFVRRYPYDAVFRGVQIVHVEAGGDRAVRFDERGRPVEPLIVQLLFDGETRQVVMRERSGLLAIDGLCESWSDLGL